MFDKHFFNVSYENSVLHVIVDEFAFLITCILNIALVLQGEVWFWSWYKKKKQTLVKADLPQDKCYGWSQDTMTTDYFAVAL